MDTELCNRNCNECPIVNHPNSRMITAILNRIIEKLDDDYEVVYPIVQGMCPNLTVCYDCRIDDFCHTEGCKLVNIKDDDRILNW